MIGYVTLGSNRYDEALQFYDSLFGSIGASRTMEADDFVAWSSGPTAPAVSVIKPFNKEPATVGNGVMVALAMATPDKVDAFHAKALRLGGTDEGAPGLRGDNFYTGYFRDLDGNKLSAFCITKD